MMKRSVLALAVSIVAAGSTANAAEVYNKDGKKLDLYGHLTAKHNFSDEDGSGTSARLGFKGEAQINDTLTAYGQWGYDTKLDEEVDEEVLSNIDSKMHRAFVGLKAGDFGSIDYGRNYGVLHDALSYTRTMPEFVSNASRTDSQMLGISDGLATYRNQNFFGLIDGLNLALQYQTPNDSTSHGFGGSISYEDIAGTGLGVVAAASTSMPLSHETKKQWDIDYEKSVEELRKDAKKIGAYRATARINEVDVRKEYQPLMNKIDPVTGKEIIDENTGFVVRVPKTEDKVDDKGQGLNEKNELVGPNENPAQVIVDKKLYSADEWEAEQALFREEEEKIALASIEDDIKKLEQTRLKEEDKYKKRSDEQTAEDEEKSDAEYASSMPFGWSAGVKYDANNVYLAAVGNQTFNLTPNSSGELAKEAFGVELVAQYDFNGFVPSVGYVYSAALEDGGEDKKSGLWAAQENYFEVGATYHFNDSFSTHVDYRINQLREQSTGEAADNELALAVSYEF